MTLIGPAFALLIVFGIPIWLVMASTAMLAFSIDGQALLPIAQKILDELNSTTLLAVPYFVAAAVFMERGNVARALINAAEAWVGAIPGGLGLVCVVCCTIFAAMCGSSVATAMAMGTVLVPAMQRAGYGRPFASGIVASAGTLGILIPPSLAFVVYGVLSDQAITRLFLAGVIPGLLQAGLIAAWVMFYAHRKGYSRGNPLPVSERVRRTVHALPALSVPVIVLGGLYGGFVTLTECAALSAVVAILLAVFVYRGIAVTDLLQGDGRSCSQCRSHHDYHRRGPGVWPLGDGIRIDHTARDLGDRPRPDLVAVPHRRQSAADVPRHVPRSLRGAAAGDAGHPSDAGAARYRPRAFRRHRRHEHGTGAADASGWSEPLRPVGHPAVSAVGSGPWHLAIPVADARPAALGHLCSGHLALLADPGVRLRPMLLLGPSMVNAPGLSGSAAFSRLGRAEQSTQPTLASGGTAPPDAIDTGTPQLPHRTALPSTRPHRTDRSLRFHLGMLSGILLLPMLLLGILLVFRLTADERTQREAFARDTARHIATSTDLALTTSRARVEVLASSELLRQGDFAGFTERAADVTRSQGSGVALYDSAGKWIGGSAVGGPYCLPGAVTPGGALLDGAQVSGFRRNPGDGRGMFSVVAPAVTLGAAPNLLLSLCVPLADVQSVLDRERITAGMTAVLVDSDGMVLAAHGDKLATAGSLLPDGFLPQVEGPWEGLLHFDDASGASFEVAFSRLSASGWMSLVVLSDAAFAAPLRRSLWFALGASLVLGGLATLLAYVFSRRIARPIAALADFAADDSRSARRWPGSVREVNEVADALTTARTEARRREMEAEELIQTLDWAQVLVRDMDGRIQVWTSGTQRLLGWTKSEVLGHTTEDILHVALS